MPGHAYLAAKCSAEPTPWTHNETPFLEGEGEIWFVIYTFLGIIGRKEFREKECGILVVIILYAAKGLLRVN
jgi:hypothetical protein